MEILFQTQTINYLAEKRYDDLHQEQTGEVTVPETLPALGRVVDCFGTVLVRDRTVDSSGGSVTVTGGIQAGVLYVPDGVEGLERLELWLPFTVTKKVQTQPDAILHYWGWLRSVEARFVNDRKLLIRADLASELTLLTPAELELKSVENCPRGFVCRTETYPMRLPLSAAEKEVRIADEVLMPEGSPGMDRLLKAQCSVELGARRILGERAVFEGELRLRILGITEANEPVTWSGTVPFSQYAELNRSMEEDASLAIQPILNHVEIDTDGQPDSLRLLVNVSFTAQMILWGEVPVALTQDAYYLEGSFEPVWQSVELSPCLDSLETGRNESLELPDEAAELLDWTLYPDRLAAAPGEEAARGSMGVNVLYYDASHQIQNKLLRQQLRIDRRAARTADWRCSVWLDSEPRKQGRSLQLSLTIRERYCQAEALRNLCGGTLTPGQKPEGPSLIVRSVSGDLWEIARDNGSTVRAIKTANELEEASLAQERLLLIPTGRGVNALEEVMG